MKKTPSIAHIVASSRSGYEAQRFDLRFFRPFRADLSIRKSSSFLPPLIAARSQRGFAPRPAQVSPKGPRYFGGTFFPFKTLPPPRTTTAMARILLFNLGTTLVKGFVNPPSQIHQCFNAHP